MVDGIKAPTIWLTVVIAFFLTLPSLVAAQEAKPARIGMLRTTEPPAVNLAAFHKGMRDRGHIEGKTYVLIPGWRKPGDEKLSNAALAKIMVDKGVDLIVSVGSSRARAARRAAPSTPIVMASSASPLRASLIKSLAKPGGTITGMSSAAVDSAPKRMEILKQLVPGLRRLGVVHRTTSSSMSSKLWSAADKQLARNFGVDVVRFGIDRTRDYDALFARIKKAGVDAITVRSVPSFTTAERKRLVDAALRAKLPNMQMAVPMVRLGGLVAFASNRAWLFRRAAAYVDLILKGARPADLPVEQASRFDLVINLKTAKALGITVPPALLLRATEVIE